MELSRTGRSRAAALSSRPAVACAYAESISRLARLWPASSGATTIRRESGRRAFMRKRRRRESTAQRAVALPRFPPCHDAFVLALMTRGARWNDPSAEREAGRALGTHAVAAPGVRSCAASRIRGIVGAVRNGETVGGLLTPFHEVLGHGGPLA